MLDQVEPFVHGSQELMVLMLDDIRSFDPDVIKPKISRN